MAIKVNSIYARRDEDDGYRVLVDDYLPDSMDEYKAGVDIWLKNIMPSGSLMSLLQNNPELWDEFKTQYFRELDGDKQCWIQMLAKSARDGNVTLYYSSTNHTNNNAVAIKEYMELHNERLGLKAA